MRKRAKNLKKKGGKRELKGQCKTHTKEERQKIRSLKKKSSMVLELLMMKAPTFPSACVVLRQVRCLLTSCLHFCVRSKTLVLLNVTRKEEMTKFIKEA